MPKTLLAVDDSATMRTVLEITFAGDDYRVITADGRASALAKLSEKPEVIIIDGVLDNEDGYALAKEVRGRSPDAMLVLLASRFNPYDAARGKDAGADMTMDKPWDAQQFVDRLKAAIVAKASAPADAPAAAAAPATPLTSTSPSLPAVTVPVAKPAEAPAAASPPLRSQTLIDSPAPAAARPAAAPIAPAAAPIQTPKTVPPAAPAAATTATRVAQEPMSPRPVASPAAALPNDFGARLGQLGLTAAQMEGVLSLSREVIERVVWEVVPTLAEVLIKEEITRLTKEA